MACWSSQYERIRPETVREPDNPSGNGLDPTQDQALSPTSRLILANRSLVNIRASGGSLGGAGTATAGRVTSIVGVVYIVLYVALVLVVSVLRLLMLMAE